MPSDPAPNRIDWHRRSEPAELPEWMDEPCSDDDLRACLRDLAQVNRLTRGYHPTLAFLDRLASARNPPQTLRILDVGFGGGDMLHHIAQWSKTRGVPVELTGIDLNPVSARIARERYPDAPVQWLTADALTWQGTADVIVSSLLTHHLPTPGVVQLVRWMEAIATVGWFVNDLERSSQSAALFGLLARVLRWHRFVRHDGPVSFARSFSRDDWQGILAQAGISPGLATLTPNFPSRLCVARIK